MDFRDEVASSYRRYLLRETENDMDYENYLKAAKDYKKDPEFLGLYEKDNLKNFFISKGYSDYQLTKSESIFLQEKRENLIRWNGPFFL